MKKIYVILAAAVAAMMVLSCQKSEEIQAPVENNQHLKTFKAIFPSDNADSKVTLDNAGKTKWAIGDVITIHGKATDELKTITLDGITNTISADGKTATFTVALDMEPDDYGSDGFYAQYPHSAYAEYESNRPRWFNCFNNTNTLLLSGVYDGTDAFVFYNVTGALSFVVDGSSFGYFDEYMIVGKNNEIVGYDHYNTRVATGDFTFNHHSSSGAKKSVRGEVVDDGTTINTVFFPVTEENDTADAADSRAECADFSNGFYIYFLKSGVITHMASTSADVRIERQSLTKLGDITANIKTYSAPDQHNATHPAIAGAEDLGATSAGTANSYIVYANVPGNANKVFKFRAYQGNSDDWDGAINSVEILWETYNNASSVTANSVIAQADFDKQPANPYYEICFKMPETLKAGNAVLVAKDIYDNVLWSWHIWVPSTTIGSDGYGISTPAMMDRNLGALIVAGTGSVQANGLFYQWGRKDPFPGIGTQESSTLATRAGTGFSKSASAVSAISYGVSHPAEFIVGAGSINSVSDSETKQDWLVTSEATRWGDSKTIYDPCPPGWRVPSSSDCTIFSDSKKPHELTGFSYDAANYCVTIGTAVFPLTGRLSYSGGMEKYKTGSELGAFVWAANSVAFASDYEGCARWMDVRGASTSNHYDERKARGAAVRCVAE